MCLQKTWILSNSSSLFQPVCANPRTLEGKNLLRKESCTGPYSKIALIQISWYRIIALNRVDEIDPYAHGCRDVVRVFQTYVHDYRDVVHVVQTGCNCVGLPLILLVRLRVGNTLDPLHVQHVDHALEM